MAYFSRLTDIVTCNLTSLLERNNNCSRFLEGIIQEMNDGVAGAQRCVATAVANVTRLETDLQEQRKAVCDWLARAQESLKTSDESQARLALERKYEVEDLIAGLEQQLQAAIGTRDHLSTMLNALEARLADAVRRLEILKSDQSSPAVPATASAVVTRIKICEARQTKVNLELEQLRQQLFSK